MANTIITPDTIASLALATLYDNMVMAGLVNRDYSGDFDGKVGDTVNVRVPGTFEVDEFDRSVGIRLQDLTESTVPIVLNVIPDVSFAVTPEELLLEIDSFQARFITPAMQGIAAYFDRVLAEAVVDAALGLGGGGTVAIGAGTAAQAFNKAREILTRNKHPLSPRYGVLSPEAVTEGLDTDLFVQAQQAGTTEALRNANLGRAYGIDTFESGTFGYGAGDVGQADGVVFHPSAVTLVTRTLPAPLGAANVSTSQFGGLGLRVVQSYDQKYKQDIISIDALYGLKAVRPSAAVVLDFDIGS